MSTTKGSVKGSAASSVAFVGASANLTKRIIVKFQSCIELSKDESIKFHTISSANEIADCLTKVQSNKSLLIIVGHLGLEFFLSESRIVCNPTLGYLISFHENLIKCQSSFQVQHRSINKVTIVSNVFL